MPNDSQELEKYKTAIYFVSAKNEETLAKVNKLEKEVKDLRNEFYQLSVRLQHIL